MSYELFVYDGSWVEISSGVTAAEIDIPSLPPFPNLNNIDIICKVKNVLQ